jgi:hypothetical protein
MSVWHDYALRIDCARKHRRDLRLRWFLVGACALPVAILFFDLWLKAAGA